MDAFENIIALYFEENGYWVKKSVKVNITKEEKKIIRLPSMPRPEVDIVALNVRDNRLLLVEVKSYINSQGVKHSSIAGDNGTFSKRYRLLNDKIYQEIVISKLRDEFLEKGLINQNTEIKLALAAGNIYSNDEKILEKYFNDHEWILITPSMIRNTIKELSQKGWEDNEIVITAKLTLKKD